jgi:DNA-binding Lrp family transcriptional regulator
VIESPSIDTIDLAVLDALQDDFPLTERPWREIAAKIGIPEDELLSRLDRLQNVGIVRGISPVIDSRCMGLAAATLVALHVPEEKRDNVAAIISSYPEVSHNFCRDHHYNLWFTLSAESGKKLGQVLGEILRKTGVDAENALDLPTLRKFKVDVRFPLAPAREDVRGPR